MTSLLSNVQTTQLQKRSQEQNNSTGGFLTFRLSGGLTNQRIRLKHGLLAGYLSGKDVVLPTTVQARTHYDAEWAGSHAGWRSVPLATLFDVPHMVTCCAALGVRVHSTLRPDDVAWTQVKTAQTFLAQAPSLHNVRLERPPLIMNPQPLAAVHALDECIKYAKSLRNHAAKIEAQVQNLAGPRQVIGLHLRLEDDALAYFGGKQAAFPRLVLNNSMACIRQAPDVARGALVYVTSGLDMDRVRSLLRSLPFEIVHRRQLSPNLHSQDDIGASVDQMVMAGLDYFVGFAPSTFSIEVAQQRRRRGKPSTLVGPCEFTKEKYEHCKLPDCELFPEFKKW